MKVYANAVPERVPSTCTVPKVYLNIQYSRKGYQVRVVSISAERGDVLSKLSENSPRKILIVQIYMVCEPGFSLPILS